MTKEKVEGKARRSRQRPEVEHDTGRLVHRSIRLDAELLGELEALAAARGMSFAAVMRSAGEMYVQREVFALGMAEMEERIGSTLKGVMREQHRIGDDVQLTLAFVDQLAKFLLITMPEVVDKKGAVALGKLRYEGFISEFHKNYNNRMGKSKLAQDLESMGHLGGD